MTIRSLVTVAVVAMGCSSGTPQTAATPQSAGDCGGRFAVTVVNEDNANVAQVFYSDARLMKPAALLGRVDPKDDRTFFFFSDEPPIAWAEVERVRVFPYDRPAQQRLRVRIVLSCDPG